ncbi:MAG: hypothetical protein K8F54_02025 [Altibacter sp.]|uniref:hypothetical protein n=1 Tax=Altibacter sp. TaxID=2024823 RepID=UPI001D96DF9C|nr:hypothetical protein [Altibacter sp.]MBZ0326358.1 hypothetical protein [Altibacter sp.]
MKKIILLIILTGGITATAQDASATYLDKVKTLDGTIETLYGVISGEKGEARNWELFRYLFTAEAKLIPTVKNKEGAFVARYMSPDEYIKTADSWLIENGFFETEIHRVTQTFGNITHVFSTYQSFHSQTETVPFMRGINSIQLLNDGERWWIVNIYWMQEAPDRPIPNDYLPKI